MKTLKVYARLKPVTKAKLDRILGEPTTRQILEVVAELIQSNPYFKNKILERLK